MRLSDPGVAAAAAEMSSKYSTMRLIAPIILILLRPVWDTDCSLPALPDFSAFRHHPKHRDELK